MNSIHTRRATALVCAAVATLVMLTGTDVLVTHMKASAVIAAHSPGTPAAQAVVITGQRASRS